MLDLIKEPWPWYVAGPLLALILFFMLYFGKTFGFSSNLRTVCSMAGAGNVASFFDIDWKKQSWNLLFLVGTILGAWIASNYLLIDHHIDINPKTISALQGLNIDANIDSYVPNEIFSADQLGSIKVLIILLGGGFLIGFGTRWAGGCTSGHAITGISSLQLPSLIATIGFFIGGLIMTHFLLPLIF